MVNQKIYQALELSEAGRLPVVGWEGLWKTLEWRTTAEPGIHVVPPLELVTFVQLPT